MSQSWTKTKSAHCISPLIVRPILECGSVVWSPWTVQDKQALEGEQRRCLGLANEDISLPLLECRINDTDLSETYKFLNDDYKLKSENVFQTNVNHLRGHSKKLLKPQPNLHHHKYFYIQRVVEPWNKLPARGGGVCPDPFQFPD